MSENPGDPKESIWTRSYKVGFMTICPLADLLILVIIAVPILVVLLIQLYWEYVMIGCLLYVAIGAAVSGGGFLITGLASYLFVSLFRRKD